MDQVKYHHDEHHEHQSQQQQPQQVPLYRNHYYGSTLVGEQYFIPIDGYSSNCSTASTSVSSSSSSDTDSLLLTSQSQQQRTSKHDQQYRISDTIFACFGFEVNPMRNDNTTDAVVPNPASLSLTTTTIPQKKRRNSAAADLQLSMLSNFSTAYNVICISLALQMMKHTMITTSTTTVMDESMDHEDSILRVVVVSQFKKYIISSKDESICSSALIAGMILGQLTLGTLGDILGRHIAMSIVMILQIIASLGSSMSYGSSNFTIFDILAIWRFLLGFGCGGVYPLSATLTTESSTLLSTRDRAKSVALTFSFQGVGYMIVPGIAYIIVLIFGESSDYGWRILLALGSVPGIALTIGRQRNSMQQRQKLQQEKQQKQKHQRLKEKGIDVPTSVYVDAEVPAPQPTTVVPNHEQQEEVKAPVPTVPSVSIIDAILYERQLVRKLLGTAGCWLLFDILFYGNVLFQPIVLSSAFGTSQTLLKTCRDAFIIAMMALPGYYISILMVGQQSPKYIQIQGFFVMGLLYLIIGTLFDVLSNHSILLLVVYGSTFFFSNYGPNATTFMLPSMTFSKSCRSTLNGICAACGKAGALIGATVFVTAHHLFGNQIVFYACSLLAFIGCLLTLVCVSDRVGYHHDHDIDDENEQQRRIEQQIYGSIDGNNVQPPPITLRMVYSHPSIF